MPPAADTPSSDVLELVERFQSILTGSWKTQTLYVAAALRIADHLAPGPQDSAHLAAAVAADPHALHRLLRALCAIEMCRERADGRFELEPLGALLQEDSPIPCAPGRCGGATIFGRSGATCCTA